MKEELSTMEKYLAQRLGINGLCDGVYSIETSFVVGQLTEPVVALATSIECANACWKMIERAMDIALNETDFPEASKEMVVLHPDLVKDYFIRFVKDEVYAMFTDQDPYKGHLPRHRETDNLDLRVNLGIYWINKSRWIRMSTHKTTQSHIYPRVVNWHMVRETDNIMF